jgi:hypothetical protein
VSFDSDSNVNDESDEHDEKELTPRNSTEAGRQIDFNDEQFWNDRIPISCSSDLNSNEMNSSDDDIASIGDARLQPQIRVRTRGRIRLCTRATSKRTIVKREIPPRQNIWNSVESLAPTEQVHTALIRYSSIRKSYHPVQLNIVSHLEYFQ